jgi:hypothetical protein
MSKVENGEFSLAITAGVKLPSIWNRALAKKRTYLREVAS